MIETNENNENPYEGFEPLTEEYLDSLSLPGEFPEFSDREKIYSTISLYDWDKIDYIENDLGISLPPEWIEEDRKFVLGTFIVLQQIRAWEVNRNKDTVDPERYLHELNKKIIETCMIKKGDEYFRNPSKDSLERLSDKKLTKEDLMYILHYLEAYLKKS